MVILVFARKFWSVNFNQIRTAYHSYFILIGWVLNKIIFESHANAEINLDLRVSDIPGYSQRNKEQEQTKVI